MKSLLTAIICLAAVATTIAAETPNKFAGRWAGIAEFGHSKNPDLNDERALLTIEVDHQGYITNGAIRDFAGYGLAGFLGQLDSNGRISTMTFPLQGTTYGELKLNLGHTSGTGTYRAVIAETWNYRSTIRLWREKKPTRNGEETSSSSLTYFIAHPTVSGLIDVRPRQPVRLPPVPQPGTPLPICTNDVITEIPPRPDRTNIIRLPPLPATPLNPGPNR